jgi:hypothetical protein
MPKVIAENPASRSSWQWEKLKAHLEEEFYNPAKFDANCKVNRHTNASLQVSSSFDMISKLRATAAVLLPLILLLLLLPVHVGISYVVAGEGVCSLCCWHHHCPQLWGGAVRQLRQRSMEHR